MRDLIGKLVTKNGRIGRIIVGIILIVVGLIWPNSNLGLILVIIGAIPVVAGALDICLLAPLAGLPLKGKEIREKLH